MKTIILKNYGKNFNLRPFARKIFSDVKFKIVEVDFQGVETASTGFCDEMILILKDENKVDKVKIIGENENIRNQIGKVLFIRNGRENRQNVNSSFLKKQ